MTEIEKVIDPGPPPNIKVELNPDYFPRNQLPDKMKGVNFLILAGVGYMGLLLALEAGGKLIGKLRFTRT